MKSEEGESTDGVDQLLVVRETNYLRRKDQRNEVREYRSDSSEERTRTFYLIYIVFRS